MIDPKIAEISRRMTAVALADRRQQILASLGTAMSNFAARGVGMSSAAGFALGKICAEGARPAAEIAWRNLWRAALAVGFQPDDEFGELLKAEVREQTRDDHERVRRALEERANRISHAAPALSMLDQARELSLRALDAEIDLAIASAKRRTSDERREVVYQFYAPVAAVVSGMGASASVVQNIGFSEKEGLSRALDAVNEAVNASTDMDDQQKTDLAELVQDARRELNKPKPNGWKLVSVLQGIGGAIQTIGSAQPAYDALKAIATVIGIQLP